MEYISLLALNNTIQQAIEGQMAPTYWVVAEISEMRLNQKGHCYLELVEKRQDMVVARLRATIWSYTYRNLSLWFEGATGQPLASGMKVLANIAVQFHPLYGLSANIKDIDANFTIGERAKKRQEVINRLTKEGVFELNKALTLPLVPQKVAIVSAPTAAGYEDFMHQLTLNRQGYKFHVKLYNALMQGEQAKASIINALEMAKSMANQFDVLVLIRGGGSQADLDCFDAYELAYHLAKFPLPVITGIGHERDETIADLVAHTKMKTPTAVSEFLISGAQAFEERLDAAFRQVHHQAGQYLARHNQQLSQSILRLKAAGESKLLQNHNKLNLISQRLKNAANGAINQQENHLNALTQAINLLDPARILKRGYTMTTHNGKAIKANTKLKAGDEIKTLAASKTIHSIVNKVEDKK